MLLAHYKLNDDVLDASGNSHHGTPTNMSYVAGKIRQAASFNGTTSLINMGNVLNIGTSDWSVGCWVKSSFTKVHGLVTKRGNNPGFDGWELRILPNGRLTMTFGGAAASTYETSATGVLVTDSQWHQCFGVWDRDGLMSTYVDGELQASLSIAAEDGYDATSAYSLVLGAINEGTQFPLDGMLDEVRIYNEALPLWKIKAFYNFGKGSEECEPSQRLIQPTIQPTIQPLIGV